MKKAVYFMGAIKRTKPMPKPAFNYSMEMIKRKEPVVLDSHLDKILQMYMDTQWILPSCKQRYQKFYDLTKNLKPTILKEEGVKQDFFKTAELDEAIHKAMAFLEYGKDGETDKKLERFEGVLDSYTNVVK